MSNEVVLREVPFYGDVILAGDDGDEILVDLKPICERLGITWQGQHEKLVSAAAEGGWASIKKILMERKEGYPREVVVVTLETFLVWLTTISLNRIDEQYRDKLRLYQQEAGKALRKAFLPQTTQSTSAELYRLFELQAAAGKIAFTCADELKKDIADLHEAVVTPRARQVYIGKAPNQCTYAESAKEFVGLVKHLAFEFNDTERQVFTYAYRHIFGETGVHYIRYRRQYVDDCSRILGRQLKENDISYIEMFTCMGLADRIYTRAWQLTDGGRHQMPTYPYLRFDVAPIDFTPRGAMIGRDPYPAWVYADANNSTKSADEQAESKLNEKAKEELNKRGEQKVPKASELPNEEDAITRGREAADDLKAATERAKNNKPTQDPPLQRA